MYSFSWPSIFTANKTILVQDKEAARNNLILVLASTKMELYGDPYFGTNLKKYLYEQNDVVLRDLIIDEVYTAIRVFVPQILTERKNITVITDRNKVSVQILYKYLNDSTPDMYTIDLTED